MMEFIREAEHMAYKVVSPCEAMGVMHHMEEDDVERLFLMTPYTFVLLAEKITGLVESKNILFVGEKEENQQEAQEEKS
jgi:hypothetical protein